MRNKKFTMGKGKYYFNLKSGQQTITIMREKKAEALLAFSYYKKIGKNCEWLGQWSGKDFKEKTAPSEAA